MCRRDACTTITLKGLCGGLVDQTIPLFKTEGMCRRDACTTITCKGLGGAGVPPALAIFFVVVLAWGCGPSEPPVQQRLADLPGLTVSVLSSENYFYDSFDLRLEQPLDHADPSSGHIRAANSADPPRF